MSFSRDVFTHQYVLVQDFVRHSAYARAIKKATDGRKLTSNFWPQSHNAHFKAAIHDWCKVFGSDGPNPTHWRHTPTADVQQRQQRFRELVLQRTKLSQIGWNTYWEQLCAFRDKYAAHLEIGKNPDVPSLNLALDISYAYDDWIRELIKPDMLNEVRLEVKYGQWLADAFNIVSTANGIGEMV